MESGNAGDPPVISSPVSPKREGKVRPPMNPPKGHNDVRLKRGVYHPPLYTGRFEGTHHQNLGAWAPSVDYNLRLVDVRCQLTPGEL